VLERALHRSGSEWLPEEWSWYRQNVAEQRGECCGIFGGRRVDFIRAYADLAWRIVSAEKNRRGLDLIHPKFAHMNLIEQYFLSAFVEYHRRMECSPFHGVKIKHLFPSVADAYTPAKARAVGYTHLIGQAKGDPLLAKRLEYRVKREYPAAYERCLEVRRDRLSPTHAR
jgi:hypothetical protein